MSAAVAATPFATPTFFERLHSNYSAHLKKELDHVRAINPIHVLSPPDIPLTRQEAIPISSWVPAHNPFAFPNAPVLPRWEQILKKFLDNEETSLHKKVEVFVAMAKAYNDSVYRPKALDADQTEAFRNAYGSSLRPYAPVPSFVNYALSVLTRSLNEKVDDDTSSESSSSAFSESSSGEEGASRSSSDSSSRSSSPHLSEQELDRLQRFGRIWFYALLQGSVDCILVGYHNVDPWHLWMGFIEHLPIAMLWHAMVLQYISYEYRFGFMYANFLSADMYGQLAHLHSDTAADSPTTLFVNATTNFKAIYEELKCAPHYANTLFVGLE
jgi:hypothetical protein